MAKKRPENKPESKKELFCPICGKKADSPHHVRPKSMGGTDNVRNIVWLCKRCHDLVEERQEQLGKELSPDLIVQMREEIHIDFVRQGYITNEGHNQLLWVQFSKETEAIPIEQYVDGIPDTYTIENEDKPKPEPIKILRTAKIRAKVGRPANDKIDTDYLEKLVYNEGLSLRKASRQLKNEGFSFSHTSIGYRIRQSPRYVPQVQAQCKYCNKLFTPKGNKRSYCSPECNLAGRRHKRELLSLDKTPAKGV